MTNSNKIDSNKRNSLGINKLVYGKLLAKLESVAEKAPNQPAKRRFTRLEYFDPYFELVLDSTKHSQRRKISVATRNISRGGMSILHSSFVYPGSRVNATLTKACGDTHQVSGKICRCEHRGGVIHEVGIIFDHEIVIQEFVKPDILDGVNSLESVDSTKLKGKVLFIGTDPSIAPFIREYLLETPLEFGFEDSAEGALQKNLEEYDLLFVSIDAGTLSGPEFIRCSRDSGLKKPIILSGRTANEEAIIHQIRFSTADLFLPLPLTQNSLLCAIGEFLINDWNERTLEKVRNSVDLESIEKMLVDLTNLADELDTQTKEENAVDIYITCTKIRNIASTLGLKSLNNMTLGICDEIADCGEIEKFADDLASINLLCRTAGESSRE